MTHPKLAEFISELALRGSEAAEHIRILRSKGRPKEELAMKEFRLQTYRELYKFLMALAEGKTVEEALPSLKDEAPAPADPPPQGNDEDDEDDRMF